MDALLTREYTYTCAFSPEFYVRPSCCTNRSQMQRGLPQIFASYRKLSPACGPISLNVQSIAGSAGFRNRRARRRVARSKSRAGRRFLRNVNPTLCLSHSSLSAFNMNLHLFVCMSRAGRVVIALNRNAKALILRINETGSRQCGIKCTRARCGNEKNGAPRRLHNVQNTVIIYARVYI